MQKRSLQCQTTHQPMIRSYSELIKFETFNERLEYLMLKDFNYDSPRDTSHSFFKSSMWLSTRKMILHRDLGCDLGIEETGDVLLVHHINPVTITDLETLSPMLFDPENLITTTIRTHNIIHYGSPKGFEYVERSAGDTKLW